MSMYVCLFICLFICLSVYVSVCHSVHRHNLKTTRPNFAKFCIHFACGRGSVLLWQRYYVPPVLWMTSCFHTMGPVGRIKQDTMFRRISPGGGTIQVGHQTATVFGWVQQNAALGAQSAIYDCLVVHCIQFFWVISLLFICSLFTSPQYGCRVL